MIETMPSVRATTADAFDVIRGVISGRLVFLAAELALLAAVVATTGLPRALTVAARIFLAF